MGSILNGRIRQLPDWAVVRGIVEGCSQYAKERGRLDRLSLSTGIEQFWRPRYATVDHALQRRATRKPPAPRQLPAAARHFAGRAGEVLVTSRDPLTSLVAAEEAHPVSVGLLSPAEAEDLLARRLGRARVAAEPEAAREIVEQCARLPLALAIAAARAATGRVPLGSLAAQLRDPGHRLGLLNAGDPTTDIRAVFAWSYLALRPPAARMFRLLGRHPGPDTTEPAMASFAAVPLSEARSLLAELTRANLLTEPAPGRYTCHDLLRAYAHDLGETETEAATIRLLDHYLHTAGAADRLLYPDRDPVVLDPPQPGSAPERLADRDRALEWLTAEHPVLLAAVEHAAAGGHDHHAWRLAWTVTGFLERGRRWSDQAAVAALGVAAAGRLGDPQASALVLRALAPGGGPPAGAGRRPQRGWLVPRPTRRPRHRPDRVPGGTRPARGAEPPAGAGGHLGQPRLRVPPSGRPRARRQVLPGGARAVPRPRRALPGGDHPDPPRRQPPVRGPSPRGPDRLAAGPDHPGRPRPPGRGSGTREATPRSGSLSGTAAG